MRMTPERDVQVPQTDRQSWGRGVKIRWLPESWRG